MKRLRVVAGTLIAFIILGVYACAGSGQGAIPGIKGGKFEVTCKYVQSKQVDPIVAHGSPLSAHLHDFFGSKTVDENSTPDSIRGDSTSCKVLDDTAAYWVPAATRTDTGAAVKPTMIFAYYFGDPAGPVEHIPAGLQLVAGVSSSTSEQSRSTITWSCGNGGNTSPVRTAPYDCTPYANNQGVVAIIAFPYCWDGTGLGPTDVTYGSSTGVCPVGTHRLPQLQEHVHYGYAHGDPRNYERGDLLALSSGPYYTEHADWMNGWNQTRLDSLVDTCLNVHKDCGFLTS